MARVALWTAWFILTAVSDARGLGLREGGNCADCNVVLVSLDTLRADHLGVYGYSRPTSPCIDRFSGQAIVFENAFSAATWTLPSHMSLFTSLHPSQHGVIDSEQRLSRGRPTLAEALQEHGYRTAAFTAGHYVSKRYGFDRGFDVYQEDYAPATREISGQGWELHQILPAAKSWLQGVGARKFFLFLHSYDTHEPFVAHSYLRDFESGYDGPLSALDDPKRFPQSPLHARFAESAGGAMNVNDFLLEVINKDQLALTAQDREHLVALYDNEIRFVDDSFCQLLAWIDAAGLAGNTIVALTSDHGEELFERGGVRHGAAPHDEQIHVPLIVRAPHLSPVRERRLVQAIDVAPTLLSMVGVPAPPAFRGRSALKAEAQPNACVVSQSGSWSAARSDRFKLIVKGENITLYDLTNDPGELKDVAREQPDEAASLRTCLAAQVAGAAAAADRIELDESHREQLRALGYRP